MIWYAEQDNYKSARGISGESPFCVPTLAGFFIGDCDMKRIPLTRGKLAIVDDEDFKEINRHKWYADWTGWNWYAVHRLGYKGKLIRMHRKIMNVGNETIEIDHKDGNGLNNQKCNLRLATRMQNAQNSKKRKNCTSKYKGVSWHGGARKWMVQIAINKKNLYMGLFESEEQAAQVYDEKAKELFGDFARTNF